MDVLIDLLFETVLNGCLYFHGSLTKEEYTQRYHSRLMIQKPTTIQIQRQTTKNKKSDMTNARTAGK
jgi:hypothetical protein